MRLKSRGLGRKELVMDFREYEVVREGDEIVIVGTIHEPVTWDFTIRVCEDDLAGILRLGLNRTTIGHLLRSLFKRDRDHHWSADLGDHLVASRERAEATRARLAAAEGGAEGWVKVAGGSGVERARQRKARRRALPEASPLSPAA